MCEDKIKKAEVDLLSAAIDRIISSEVLQSVMSDQLPLTSNLTDSNKIYRGKASILFVDMRESSKLPDEFNSAQLVKIYRSYIRTVVQAIRYSGGVVRDFMGDGVLSVFIDNEEGKAEDKAVRAARYIATTVDKLLNPVLNRAIKHRISCGIGIHTGEVTLSKVGMKGKGQQDDAENEFGLAWIGNSTNLSCKFSGAVGNSTIFISPSTYSNLSDICSKENWRKIEIAKGKNTLIGYIAKQYYLQLDNEIEPCTATETDTPLGLIDELKQEYKMQLADITRKAEELGRKEQSLQDKEKSLYDSNIEMDRKNRDFTTADNNLKRQIFYFHCDVVGSAHCKKEYTLAMGQSFWEGHCTEAIQAGIKFGMTAQQVKQKISYAMVDIYQSLDIYDKAYDFLVEQATGCSWLHLSTVQDIVNKVGYCDRLKSALYMRLAKDDLSPENKLEFERIKNWLVFEYRKN